MLYDVCHADVPVLSFRFALNIGWPCWEGPIHTPEYDWGTGPGAALCAGITMTLPVAARLHPTPPVIQWSGNVMVRERSDCAVNRNTPFFRFS